MKSDVATSSTSSEFLKKIPKKSQENHKKDKEEMLKQQVSTNKENEDATEIEESRKRLKNYLNQLRKESCKSATPGSGRLRKLKPSVSA